MRVPAAALIAALLLTGCSDDGSPQSVATPVPTSSSTAPATDPYAALTPPTSPGVGSYPALVAGRAYLQSQGLLALQLLEPATLTGKNSASLARSLRGRSEDLSVQRDLGEAPTEAGLKYRPLLASSVTVGPQLAEVVRSDWSADEVQGRGGESALRITWNGAVRYHVTVDGQPRELAYALVFSYVYALVANEPNGIVLETVIPGGSHLAPVVGACLSKGVVLPTGDAPTDADFGRGPYPAASTSGTCPV